MKKLIPILALVMLIGCGGGGEGTQGDPGFVDIPDDIVIDVPHVPICHWEYDPRGILWEVCE